MKMPTPDPYEVLHLGRSATPREVTRAFRALVRTHHPDTNPAQAVPGDPRSTAQELRDIMDAYALLRDPAKRAAYDRQRLTSLPPGPAPEGRPHFHARADLIIGPVQWESPSRRARYPQAGGSGDPFKLWWIRR